MGGEKNDSAYNNKEEHNLIAEQNKARGSQPDQEKIVGQKKEILSSPNIQQTSPSSKNPESQTKGKNKKVYKEKSKFINTLRVLALVIGAYYFGYYKVITNVLGQVLTKEVYNMKGDAVKKRIGDFGSLHSLGSFISILLTGFFTKNFGRVKLLMVLEIFTIGACFLHRIESMPLLLVLRFFDGFLGALNYSIIPSLVKELLPRRLVPLGAHLTYTLLVFSLLLGSLTNYIFGGYEGLTRNWKLVISFPAYIGIFRLLLLLILFPGLESPAFYINHFFKKREILKKKLLVIFGKIYIEEDALKKTEDLIAEEERILAKLGLKERKKN